MAMQFLLCSLHLVVVHSLQQSSFPSRTFLLHPLSQYLSDAPCQFTHLGASSFGLSLSLSSPPEPFFSDPARVLALAVPRPDPEFADSDPARELAPVLACSDHVLPRLLLRFCAHRIEQHSLFGFSVASDALGSVSYVQYSSSGSTFLPQFLHRSPLIGVSSSSFGLLDTATLLINFAPLSDSVVSPTFFLLRGSADRSLVSAASFFLLRGSADRSLVHAAPF